ncbi:MAG: class I SAM-dependent methyltransferase [Candidatus Caldarchaeales archaeon]
MSDQFYDVPAQGYIELYGEEQLRKYLAVFNNIDLQPSKILDIGCGVGLLSRYLESIGFGGEFIGIDIDIERVKFAKKTFGEFIVADAHHLPFRDKCFQTSTIFTVIHLLKVRDALREAERVSENMIIITILKKRTDLRDLIIQELKNLGRLVEIDDSSINDYIFILYLD